MFLSEKKEYLGVTGIALGDGVTGGMFVLGDGVTGRGNVGLFMFVFCLYLFLNVQTTKFEKKIVKAVGKPCSYR